MKKISFFCFLLFVVACSKEEKWTITKLPEPEVFLSDESLNDPYSLAVSDKFLVLKNWQSDTIIDVYDLQSRHCITHALPRGQGPNEGLHTTDIQYAAKEACFYLPDWGHYVMYQLKEADFGEPMAPVSVAFRFNPEQLADSVILRDWWKMMDNGKIVASNATPKGMLAYCEPSLAHVDFLAPYPKKEDVNPELDDWGHIGLYQCSSAASPDGRKVAAAYHSADFLNLLTVDENGSASVQSIVEALPNDIYVIQAGNGMTQGAFTGDSYLYYVDVTATDRSVYALYSGKRNRDCARGISRGNFVRVYDWEGNRKCMYDLGTEVLGIAVSPDEAYLYAVSSSSEEGLSVLRYQLD
ncbi:MAG: hypothetical protein IAA73_07885 [Bacteroidetes bacterium]|uniref:Uncharacterized protein n=1 Tax=Candidatus Gallipaludibacter merdavium TaxID=2840839 RepID=A0A9D9N4R3_9BACT|nr:hypothetical protein [Candidatus Gallipaludibacter merdavium]